jgi:hypothetical protein
MLSLVSARERDIPTPSFENLNSSRRLPEMWCPMRRTREKAPAVPYTLVQRKVLRVDPSIVGRAAMKWPRVVRCRDAEQDGDSIPTLARTDTYECRNR